MDGKPSSSASIVSRRATLTPGQPRREVSCERQDVVGTFAQRQQGECFTQLLQASGFCTDFCRDTIGVA
jgi:hypothetical protein